MNTTSILHPKWISGHQRLNCKVCIPFNLCHNSFINYQEGKEALQPPSLPWVWKTFSTRLHATIITHFSLPPLLWVPVTLLSNLHVIQRKLLAFTLAMYCSGSVMQHQLVQAISIFLCLLAPPCPLVASLPHRHTQVIVGNEESCPWPGTPTCSNDTELGLANCFHKINQKQMVCCSITGGVWCS